ncbi:MAG: type II secretion system F family protein [Bdellovibrio sp.]|nr:type II secretion system F family protein [Bdellovibrio sp.]
MPEFEYVGIDKSGKKTTGKFDAPSEGDLRVYLRSKGIRPMRIKKINAFKQDLGKIFRSSGRTMSLETLVSITRQLHALITSGIPLVQGLEFLAEQAATTNIKTIITVMKEKVSQGSYLWEALGLYPKIFPKFYVSLVKVGEASGALDLMFKRLNRYLETSNKLTRIVKGAMMYPLIITCLGIVVISAMLIFVIPKFEELLKSNNQELPGPTQLVIFMSHFVAGNIIYIILVLVTAGFILSQFIKSKEGRAQIDQLVFKTPLFGPLIQKSSIARFSRTLQIMLSSGINLLDAIDICKSTMNNAVLEDAVSTVRKNVEGGKNLGGSMSKLHVFPRMSVQMIAVGEASGNLDKMLEKVADFYEEEVEITINSMTKLIEPLILIVLGGAVGGLLIAMYLPIFKLAGGAGGP